MSSISRQTESGVSSRGGAESTAPENGGRVKLRDEGKQSGYGGEARVQEIGWTEFRSQEVGIIFHLRDI